MPRKNLPGSNKKPTSCEKASWWQSGQPALFASLVALVAFVAYSVGSASSWSRPARQAHKHHPYVGHRRPSQTPGVERHEWEPDKPFAEWLAKRARPAVLRHTVIDTWQARWTWTLEYLAQRIPAQQLSGVYRHHSPHMGPFYDPARPMHGLRNVHRDKDAYEPNATLATSELPTAMQRSPVTDRPYLMLVSDVALLGDDLVQDILPMDEFLKIDPSYSSVNLWMGQPGVVTPCHYDGYHNLYAQLEGRKHFLLFPPQASARELLPFPFLHPSYGQCQMNVSASTASEMPTSVEVELGPGDLLYLPPFWGHHVTAVTRSLSVNAWTRTSEEPSFSALLAVPRPACLSSAQPGEWSEEQRGAHALRAVRGLLLATIGRAGAIKLTRELFDSRYSLLVSRGVLEATPSTDLCGIEIDTSAKHDVDQFVTAARNRLEELLKATADRDAVQGIWLSNFVEAIVAQASGISRAASVLRDLSRCLSM